jgi:class 3 adenylate cyclase
MQTNKGVPRRKNRKQSKMKTKPSTEERKRARKRSQGKGDTGDRFTIVRTGYKRALLLGSFIDAGRAPKMVDVEVAVCFADLRGFTNYVHRLQKDGQDNKVQHFLRSYFQIYPEAVLHAIWSLEPDDQSMEISESEAELRRLVVPTSYKNLGDGMMLIWELQTASTPGIQGLATRYILRLLEIVEEMFRNLTMKLTPLELDSYSEHACDLRMGFGLTRGHAWRLDFGHRSPADYAGSIVNLAARLQSIARPSGVVAQLGFSQSKFDEKVKAGEGKIQMIKSPKGLGNDPLQVWTSPGVTIPSELLIASSQLPKQPVSPRLPGNDEKGTPRKVRI